MKNNENFPNSHRKNSTQTLIKSETTIITSRFQIR